MTRAIIVGIGAAIVGLLLISLYTYFELRYTQNGAFIRDWASSGVPDSRYGDPIMFMGKSLRIYQFVVSPSISFLIGLMIGFVDRRRTILAAIIGIAPIILISHPTDVYSAASALMCILLPVAGTQTRQSGLSARRIGESH